MLHDLCKEGKGEMKDERSLAGMLVTVFEIVMLWPSRIRYSLTNTPKGSFSGITRVGKLQSHLLRSYISENAAASQRGACLVSVTVFILLLVS